ncbi:MAG: NADH:ubiquinone reductase (Na(+)-transporting) subunit C [Elusimicrobia bacterium CG_4_9_14_3_um_filter_62_55]|nr:MAG: NADH:ubiquinone reductase (Na(+)-transporting) subunit C [Elusimicrobia bacterium CG22_combo_CG10-13_8_21_14_all_63_91]PJA14912.1 MAG: NADH:ubiquinone reductase (Na(+)-transporting) subunit C [Elusimicrobia bacterium CG_4_10_14_0_2_um_filter_63_34]PJB25994.1 MAG: NADH:ubiquinone reductase (Na(+)-transporting) subunit C [Elusimicrobia bacterium CG_4_9_14_3_um_filter_62_55]
MSKTPSTSYTLTFAAVVCVVCSLVVSSAAILLKDRQERNVLLDKQKNILGAVGLHASNPDEIASLYASKIKELEVTDAKLPLYAREENGAPAAYAFPISGKGLWSTLYGYLALEPDGDTVKGITFYKHGETPGLGAEIEKPWFQQNFVGKKILGSDGSLASVAVVKGKVAELIAPDQQSHFVDGISGATLTSKGVTKLVRAGLERYEPFLKTIRKEQQ